MSSPGLDVLQQLWPCGMAGRGPSVAISSACAEVKASENTQDRAPWVQVASCLLDVAIGVRGMLGVEGSSDCHGGSLHLGSRLC